MSQQSSNNQGINAKQPPKDNQVTPEENTLPNSNSSNAKISQERAIEIALEKASIIKTDVRDLEVELDFERGVLVWEIDFEYQNFDYSYDVHADTGEIVFEEIENDKLS